jgi:hypothetical protein
MQVKALRAGAKAKASLNRANVCGTGPETVAIYLWPG